MVPFLVLFGAAGKVFCVFHSGLEQHDDRIIILGGIIPTGNFLPYANRKFTVAFVYIMLLYLSMLHSISS